MTNKVSFIKKINPDLLERDALYKIFKGCTFFFPSYYSSLLTLEKGTYTFDNCSFRGRAIVASGNDCSFRNTSVLKGSSYSQVSKITYADVIERGLDIFDTIDLDKPEQYSSDEIKAIIDAAKGSDVTFYCRSVRGDGWPDTEGGDSFSIATSHVPLFKKYAMPKLGYTTLVVRDSNEHTSYCRLHKEDTNDTQK